MRIESVKTVFTPETSGCHSCFGRLLSCMLVAVSLLPTLEAQGTPAVSSSPTASPSLAPSLAPTQLSISTLSPNLLPSFVPTKFSSMQPTGTQSMAPSKIASDHPSSLPSFTPSSLTSAIPSLAQSLVPTSTTSFSPTKLPSGLPTLAPSVSPTSGPSSMPSVTGSQQPTGMPSRLPTSMPSYRPSSNPSSQPTNSPSAIPSASLSPSSSPTTSPSLIPTTSPSSSPTSEPSHTPSSSPSSLPSLSPTLVLQSELIEVVMIFDNSPLLGRSAIITWEKATEEHIRDEIARADLENPLFDLEVGTNLQTQEIIQNNQRRRRLQASPLKITFDTSVEFRSLSTDLDIAVLIGGAFNNANDREEYLDRLQSSGDRTFISINDVRVEINGVPQIDDESAESGIGLPVIVGAAAGGAAVVIIGMLIYLVFCRKGKSKAHHSLSTPTTAPTSGERMNTEILVEPQDEISTLGDPTYAQGMTMGVLEKDDTVSPSIVSGDYDYARNYGGRPNMVPSVSESGRSQNMLSAMDASARGEGSSADLSAFGLTKMDTSLFSDDSSFEQQFTAIETRFEVVAPAGKLGMVIDTPNGQVPVVHAIKDTSVLADKVQVGDRLMSVDDEDTTGMTAMQVSKLISVKADNLTRTLVFARTRNRTGTEDVLGPYP